MKYFFDSEEAKARLIEESGKWIGTPFHEHACVRLAGVDCVHLVAAIYQAVGVLKEFKPPQYAMDGGQHDDSSKVIEYVHQTGRFECMNNRSGSWACEFGDLLCFRLGKVAFHTAIKLHGDNFIQVMQRHTVSDGFTLQDSTWSSRLTAVYRPLSINSQPSTINHP
jgi:cell wall-associated NlpC family hydrolase